MANPNDKVEIYIPIDTIEKTPNYVIGINGKNWVIPRGEPCKVPRFVYDEYERSVRARYKADGNAAKMSGLKLANAEAVEEAVK